MRARITAVVALCVFVTLARADGPQDNIPNAARPIPKAGIEVSAADRAELQKGSGDLKTLIDRLGREAPPRLKAFIPDIVIYWKAVHDALEYNEFLAPQEIPKARALLAQGMARAQSLLAGNAPWTTQTGLVARGYVSRIDGSVQPYGVEIPESYTNQVPHRLDFWFHGRGETLTELNFIDGRQRARGTFSPPNTIVLHPYGRFCNAFRFAGEVDVLEALQAVRASYRIDDDRICVRGFSMGGAACWQFAVHYSDQWCAANPGAGFTETVKFLEMSQKQKPDLSWFEGKLIHLYDSIDYAANLRQLPTVAYSGELDAQKQATDMMIEALAQERIELAHVIGPKTKHAYEPRARDEVERRISSIAQRGRQRMPREVTLATYTLKYNRMNWVTIDALGEHWKKATVQARIAGDSRIEVKTDNVAGLTLEMPAGWCELAQGKPVVVAIDGAEVTAPVPLSDRSWSCALERGPSGWRLCASASSDLRKRHDLQGPIDDAFMDSFLIVRPTGKSASSRVDSWSKQELQHAIEQWRRQFRGEARVKNDSEVTDADLASANLVLWGDPKSNAVLGRISERLPIRWTETQIQAGDRSYPAENHALLMIYPNPLNPKRYVVLNSGFTYREYDYLNNARQFPKLPDWAVVDVRTPPDAVHPGKVVDADFFGEAWGLRPWREERGKPW
jgi:dienelactone hydrolase